MPRNRRPRGAMPKSTNFRTSQKPRGLYINQAWHCDCRPERLPAQRFQVKKEGPNTGRWFWTCQKSGSRGERDFGRGRLAGKIEAEPRGCRFFLWDEDARVRVEAVVLKGRVGEVDDRRDDEEGGVKRSRAAFGGDEEEESNDAKRQRRLTPEPKREEEDSSGEDEFWSLTADDMAQVEQASASPTLKRPRTPSPPPTHAVFSTSTAAAVPPHTPHKPSSSDGATLPSPPPTTHHHHPHHPQPTEHSDLPADPQTPTSTLPPTAGATTALLRTLHPDLPASTYAQLSDALATHDARVRGVLRGRDRAREELSRKQAELSRKEAELARQTSRIAELEAEVEAAKVVVRFLREERGRGAS